MEVSNSSVEETVDNFQGLLRQNAEGMDMVMEMSQALSEALNSMVSAGPRSNAIG